MGGVSWVTVRLSPDPKGGTRLELEHAAHVEEHWKKFGPGAVGIGWDLGLLGLGTNPGAFQEYRLERSTSNSTTVSPTTIAPTISPLPLKPPALRALR